jgi:hypothetical protein
VLVALTWELEETNGVEGDETLLAIPHYPIYQCSDRGSHHASTHHGLAGWQASGCAGDDCIDQTGLA